MNTEDGLKEYLSGLFKGETTREWYNRHEKYLTEASPRTVNNAIDKLVAQSDDYYRLDESVAQFIRAASRGLDKYTILSPPDGHYLEILIRENRALEQLRNELKNLFKRQLRGAKDVSSGVSAVLRQLQGLISTNTAQHSACRVT